VWVKVYQKIIIILIIPLFSLYTDCLYLNSSSEKIIKKKT